MKNLDKVILVDAVHVFVVESDGGFFIFKEMFSILEKFPQRKILLTGADDEQFKKFGLGNMPYEVFTLKHNPEKTDPNYFHTLLRTFGLKPDQAVYFEHDRGAVRSAESVGITTYFYDSEQRNLDELERFLQTNLQLAI